ncbi:hypothetical protein [Massilia sp. PWRC2]|uniref:hypothetical protein n=1 Tax=Massilia sp. PWRC2 TaxID=2804626 RepID=UPI003CF9C8BA
MAESDFSTGQCAQPRTKAQVARRADDLDRIDTINARHNQVLGILGYILANLEDLDEGTPMPPAVLSSTLWAAQVLLEQAQEAATTL